MFPYDVIFGLNILLMVPSVLLAAAALVALTRLVLDLFGKH